MHCPVYPNSSTVICQDSLSSSRAFGTELKVWQPLLNYCKHCLTVKSILKMVLIFSFVYGERTGSIK